ncbi:MAG: ATP-grasp domain-containing protein [Phenylobacterium sp.]
MNSESTPATAATDLLVIRGAPSDRVCWIDVEDGFTPPRFIVHGTASFLPYVPELLPRARQLWLDQLEKPMRLELRRTPIINYLADADIYDVPLRKADRIVQQMARPVFNAPTSVLGTRRDLASQSLADVAGVYMPRTVRAPANTLAGLIAAVEGAGLTYPLLLRPTGTHGGLGMVKVDRAEDLGPAQIRFGEGEIYITEFVDFADPDGLYRKHRLVVVGEEVFMRHVIVGEAWLLHAERRAQDTGAEELAALAGFEKTTAPAIRTAMMGIARTLGLDYFGVDCSIRPDGQVLVFEANACMNILLNSAPSPNMWDAPIAAILAALRRLLDEPGRWRGQPTVAA